MSPTILALFSDRGVDHHFRDRGRTCWRPHRCRPDCRARGCGWLRLMSRDPS